MLFKQKVKLYNSDFGGDVSLWEVDSVTGRKFFSSGVEGIVIGQSMNGYLFVQIDGNIFEVWHENVQTASN